MKYLHVLTLLFLFSCGTTRQSSIEKPNPNALIDITHAPIDARKQLQTITFGSCNKENEPQPFWTEMQPLKPDLWIWLGDNIYADTNEDKVFRAKYNRQLSNKDYAKFVRRTPVVGIWDDHDYGVNNGGKEFAQKDIAKAAMLDFLQVPTKAEVRKREGAYQSYTFGKGDTQVKVILLDSRYFRDAPIRENRNYIPNETGMILGAAQWKWLENELKNSNAKIHLIANGIQVLQEEHAYEKWENFPNERQKLLDLLIEYQVDTPILLSGDRHISEFARMEYKGKSIVEFTSSGLTHSYDALESEPNKHRVGKLITSLSYGCMMIDWSGEIPKVTLQIRGKGNKVLEEIRF